MSQSALFDLPAYLLDPLDNALAYMGLAPWLRVVMYGGLAAMVMALLYWQCTNQKRLRDLRHEQARATVVVSHPQLTQTQIRILLRYQLHLALEQLRGRMQGLLIGSLALIVFLPWLSDRFSYLFPTAGALIAVCPTPILPPAALAKAKLHWTPSAAANWDSAQICWRVHWPGLGQVFVLRDGDEHPLFTIPLAVARPALYQHHWWNVFLGNPAGYLPRNAPIQALAIALPERELLTFGPPWIRRWEFVFFTSLLVVSLGCKFFWRLI